MVASTRRTSGSGGGGGGSGSSEPTVVGGWPAEGSECFIDESFDPSLLSSSPEPETDDMDATVPLK